MKYLIPYQKKELTDEKIKEELNSVPTLPGVYLWKDKSGQVIYVARPSSCAPACAST